MLDNSSKISEFWINPTNMLKENKNTPETFLLIVMFLTKTLLSTKTLFTSQECLKKKFQEKYFYKDFLIILFFLSVKIYEFF